MKRVPIGKLSFDALETVIGPQKAAKLRATVSEARRTLRGRTIWHVNSTAQGGGVAEMLQTILAYEHGAGIDVRWLVLKGDPLFFVLTKRLHHRLHGERGDDGALGTEEKKHYDNIARHNVEQMLTRVRRRDIVVLHDPQTAGLVPALRATGALVIWRCHIGMDEMNATAYEAWQFLRPHIEAAHATIFSRAAYAPTWLSSSPIFIMPPATDALSAKNLSMSRGAVRAILRHIGLVNGTVRPGLAHVAKSEWLAAQVKRRAEIVQTDPVPSPTVPLIAQVSRWDPLKDMPGVIDGFVKRLPRLGRAHLALVGPDPRGVTDDPEGLGVYEECVDIWRELPPSARERVHLVCLPMADVQENAVMVNAVQRHAAVVVQKSLREGFGLTVTEAMYKARPIIGSRVGGIQDQIVDGIHGLLIDDPADTAAFGQALERLLRDEAQAKRMGRNAQRRAIAHYLGPRQLTQLFELVRMFDD